MEDEPILAMKTDRVTPRYVYHKPFTVKFPGRMDSNQTSKEDWSGTQTGLRPIKALVLRYTDEA